MKLRMINTTESLLEKISFILKETDRKSWWTRHIHWQQRPGFFYPAFSALMHKMTHSGYGTRVMGMTLKEKPGSTSAMLLPDFFLAEIYLVWYLLFFKLMVTIEK